MNWLIAKDSRMRRGRASKAALAEACGDECRCGRLSSDFFFPSDAIRRFFPRVSIVDASRIGR